LFLSWAGAVQAQESDSITVPVGDGVTVTVQITSPRNGFVTCDDCVKVSGVASARGSSTIEFMFIMDSSGSLQSNDPMDFRKSGALALVGALEGAIPALRMGVVDFDGTARLLQGLTTDANAVRAAINSLDQNGNTDIAAGINTANIEFLNSRPGATKVALLFTDGENNVGCPPVLAAAMAAAAQGITINTVILFGTAPAVQCMQDVAMITGGQAVQTTDPQELVRIFGTLPSPGLDRVEYSLNGGPFIRCNLAAGVFNCDVCNLLLGKNVIVVKATATTGQSAMDSITVTRTSEGTAPVAHLVSESRNGLRVTFNGTVSDNAFPPDRIMMTVVMLVNATLVSQEGPRPDGTWTLVFDKNSTGPSRACVEFKDPCNNRVVIE
jgi:Mg-chelatase subunit ChlD